MTQPLGYAVVLAAELGDKTSLSMQFNFELGASAETMNKELDKLTAVFERQKARAEVPRLEQYLKAQKLILTNIEDDLRRGQDKQAGLEPRGPQYKQLGDALNQQKIQLEDVRKKIAAGDEELAELRKKAV